MALQNLSLESLPQLSNGLLKAAIDEALEKIASDCDDRPHDKRSRVLTVQLSFVPIPNTNGANAALDTVKMAAPQVEVKLPKLVFPDVSLGLRKKRGANGQSVGHFTFNDLSEDDVHQRTIDEA